MKLSGKKVVTDKEGGVGEERVEPVEQQGADE
jgi:hypothetical protein